MSKKQIDDYHMAYNLANSNPIVKNDIYNLYT